MLNGETPGDDAPRRFGELLRTHRRRVLLSQEGLAGRAGLSVRTIRELERGRVRAPRWDSVRLLADALGLDGTGRAEFEAIGTGRPGTGPLPSSVGTPVAPVQLPPDIADFTGRERALHDLRAFLVGDGAERTGGVVSVAVVAGRAGVGKTALAIRLAHAVGDAFPDGRLYADLKGAGPAPLDPGTVLARFLHALGVDGKAVPDGTDERSAAFRAQVAGRRVLVVLDDAGDEAQVRPLLPGAPGCAVLVTARARLVGLAGAHLLDLDVLSPAKSLELLARIAGARRIAAEPAAAQAIARWCGRLPLALRVCGARLAARQHWSLAHLAGLLADERHRLDELAVADLAVRASIGLTEQSITATERRAFHLLGLLGAVDVADWTVAALLDVPLGEAETVAEALVDARLLDVTRIAPDGRPRYGFHDLVRLYARERAEQTWPASVRDVAACRVLGTWLALAEQADRNLPSASDVAAHGDAARVLPDPKVVERVVADPLGWFDTERGNLAAAVDHACVLELDELAWELASCLVTFSIMRSDWDLLRRTADAALDRCRQSGNRRGAACMRTTIGKLHIDQGNPELAEHELRPALRLFRELGEQQGQIRVLIELGTALTLLDRADEAIGDTEQAVGLARAAGYDDGLADALMVLGWSRRQTGDTEGAAADLHEAARRYAHLGKPRGEAQALWQLATARALTGHRDDAVALLRRCAVILGRIADQRGRARVLLDLGELQVAAGDAEQAAASLDASIAASREIGERGFQGRALHALGLVHAATGHAAEALACLTDAGAIWTELGDVDQLDRVRSSLRVLDGQEAARA